MSKTKITITIILVIATILTAIIWGKQEYHTRIASSVESMALDEGTITTADYMRGLEMRNYAYSLAMSRITLIYLIAGSWCVFLGLRNRIKQ